MDDLIVFSHPTSIPQWVENIIRYINQMLSQQKLITVHRSKLFALMDDYRTLVSTFSPDFNLRSDVVQRNVTILYQAVSQSIQLIKMCSAAEWSQAAMNNKTNFIRDMVRKIRYNVHESLIGLNCRTIPQFLISEEQLNAQNNVDLIQLKGSLVEYIANTHFQEQTPEMQHISQIVNERLKSIGPVDGCSDGPATESVAPFLPARLNLFLRHDQFQIGDLIGKGTFGSVYNGVLVENNRRVAIKVLHSQILAGRQLETFKREVWTMATLNHPSILKLYGVTLTPPFCIVTELLNGSLFDHLHVINPTQKSLIALRISQGMEQLHSAQIIHRDLKTSNILLDSEYNPRVCDFGLVTFKSSTTRTGFVGTSQWMAPEILRSSPFYDEKVDVYSFGVMLWEMITNQEPYANMSQDQIVMGVIEQGMRPPTNNLACPVKLVELLHKCWAEQPSQRPTFSQITSFLVSQDCHFYNTNEQEFLKFSPKAQISIQIIQSFDTGDWKRLKKLLKEIDRASSERDSQLVPVLVTIFPALPQEMQCDLIIRFTRIVDFEYFLSMKGYQFIISILTMSQSVISAMVESLRTISLNAKSFRQVQLIHNLLFSNNSDAIMLCADLCEYPDIAEHVVFKELPINCELCEREVLYLYNNLLIHDHLKAVISNFVEPIVISTHLILSNPDECCRVLSKYQFLPSHASVLIESNIIFELSQYHSYNPKSLKALAHIFAVISLDQLFPYRDLIQQLIVTHRRYFSHLIKWLSQLEGIGEITAYDPI